MRSEPTCPHCEAKFPGDPCNRCHLPADLPKVEVAAWRREQLREKLVAAGVSKTKARRGFRPAAGNRKRCGHGRR